MGEQGFRAMALSEAGIRGTGLVSQGSKLTPGPLKGSA